MEKINVCIRGIKEEDRRAFKAEAARLGLTHAEFLTFLYRNYKRVSKNSE